ncbi:MAG: hypothetical protein MSC31_18845 [Solirubrobacteraceae bacterium MAG38_C4-C5]|nr:hypothetical protein [Candidatus Siliceabacter maunaloa]
MTDDELTDAWQAGMVFPKGISHEQHLRIVWYSIAGTAGSARSRCSFRGRGEPACYTAVQRKFDATLTARWSRAVAEAAQGDGLGPSRPGARVSGGLKAG